MQVSRHKLAVVYRHYVGTSLWNDLCFCFPEALVNRCDFSLNSRETLSWFAKWVLKLIAGPNHADSNLDAKSLDFFCAQDKGNRVEVSNCKWHHPTLPVVSVIHSRRTGRGGDWENEMEYRAAQARTSCFDDAIGLSTLVLLWDRSFMDWIEETEKKL